MRRRILIVLLALGTVGGYGAGFASMRCHGRWRRAAFEQHVAQICTDAARNPSPAPSGASQDSPSP